MIAQPPITTPKSSLEIIASRHLTNWLAEQNISLAFTTYQTCRLLLLGLNPAGQLSGYERIFDRVMGLYATTDRLYLSSKYQLWQLDNVLAPGQLHNGYDKLYIPRIAHTTGDLDVHDIAVDSNGRVIFVSTLLNCLATLSDRHSCTPIWKPPFISQFVNEDRCHLNSMAMVDGQPRYLTAVSQSDVVDGWRDKRDNGGCVIDIQANQVILTGLSMPHSPRWYQGKLWVLNSGTGDFGYVDLEKGVFESVAFCPGYMRGLAFWHNYAIIGLSKPRERTFSGLALDKHLAAKGVEPRCGLMIIDLLTGNVADWLRLEGVVTELYDVQVLPQVKRPMALGFQTDEIQRLITLAPVEPLL